MNKLNEEIHALRVAIEHINWMLEQSQYQNVKTLLQTRRNQYLKDLRRCK